MPVNRSTPPISGIGTSFSSASPNSSGEPITSAATIPVARRSTPNIRLRREVGTTGQLGGPPPRPANAPAKPIAPNSRFQSSSRLEATSRPPTYMTTQSRVTSTRVRMFGICRATAPQSILAASSGVTGGQRFVSDSPENRSPAASASPSVMPSTARPR